jgi:glycosyltransferase involved in cell wall biosynthesis
MNSNPSTPPGENRNYRFRHCMLVHAYYPYDETRVQRQAEALVARNIQVDVICLRYGDEPRFEVAGGVNVYRLPVQRNKKRGQAGQFMEYLAFLALAFFQLTRLHLKHAYRVVQVHNLPDFLIFAALAPRLSGSKLILDLHDLMPEFYCARFNTPLDSLPVRLIQWQESLCCRFAHHVITVTEAWRQTLIQRGTPAEKISVVMNVPDPRYFSTAGRENKTNANGSFRFVYHGSITRRYGLDLVLQALAQTRQQMPQAVLNVYGRGEFLEEILRLIQEYQLQDRVQVSPEYLPSAELAARIQASDVGLVPYRKDIFTDGILPTKLMEYVATGVPVIAARTTAISTYFDDEMVAFFSPGDVQELAACMTRLYAQQDRLDTLAHQAAAFSRKYHFQKVAEEYTSRVERLALGKGL